MVKIIWPFAIRSFQALTLSQCCPIIQLSRLTTWKRDNDNKGQWDNPRIVMALFLQIKDVKSQSFQFRMQRRPKITDVSYVCDFMKESMAARQWPFENRLATLRLHLKTSLMMPKPDQSNCQNSKVSEKSKLKAQIWICFDCFQRKRTGKLGHFFTKLV